MIRTAAVVLSGVLGWLAAAPVLAAEGDMARLRAIADGAHRSEANRARNAYRHPVETLEFFGLTSGMTVVEILPGGGWYTEILAPFLKGNGTFYAAHFSQQPLLGYQRPMLDAFQQRLADNPDQYSEVILTHLFPPNEMTIAPPGSADLALTFRNVHNWIMAGSQREHFAAFFAALKPGGTLGVVEHRAPAGASLEFMQTSGYVDQDYVIQLAQEAGFEFVTASEINANPRDTKDYPDGVWTLPPTYELGETDRARFAAIGESDRMTLKFRKPR